MSNALFQSQLANAPGFLARVAALLANSLVAVANEVADEIQSLSVTGSPTGGNFVLAGLPGSTVIIENGTTVNNSASVTGLNSTVGLWVGMTVTGSGIPANTTIASITSTTAITLSANATAGATVPLTFSGTPQVTINWNATYEDVQQLLGNLAAIGAGSVVCAGGPLPGTAISITWTGSLGHEPIRLPTFGTNGLTGGTSPAPAISRTTAGVAFPYHAQRQALARSGLLSPQNYVPQFAVAVAGNATVQADWTLSQGDCQLAGGVTETTADNDMTFAINSFINAFALSQ